MNTILLFIERFKKQSFIQVFTIYLRYLVGGAFVIASIGMGKFSGDALLISKPGAPIETLAPISQFFRVMAMSGLYWQFIGWSQIIAGGLLMTQRYAKLGALLFFTIILNIFIITVSYRFQGTPVVTGLMLLAATFLVLWDLESFQYLLVSPAHGQRFQSAYLPVISRPYWALVGACMFITLVAMGLLKVSPVIQLLSAFSEGLVAYMFYMVALQRKVYAPR